MIATAPPAPPVPIDSQQVEQAPVGMDYSLPGMLLVAHHDSDHLTNYTRDTESQSSAETHYAFYIAVACNGIDINRRSVFVDATESFALESQRLLFYQLLETWKRETGMFSLIQQKLTHPSYFAITGMSWDAVPFILHELQNGAAHLLPALRGIVRKSAPDESGATSFEAAVKIWTAWWNVRQSNAWLHSIS